MMRQLGSGSGHSADGRKVVRLMSRCQRHKLAEFANGGLVDDHRRAEAQAAMDDAMAGGNQFEIGQVAQAS